MNKYTIILLSSSIIWLFLGIKTLLNDINNSVNRLFCLICLSIVIFHSSLGIGYSQETNRHVFTLANMAYIGMYFFIPLNLHFYLELSRTKIKHWLLALAYAPAFILNIAQFSGYSIFRDIVKRQGEWIGIYDYGISFYAYTCYSLLLVLISLRVIYKWGKRTTLHKEKIYSKIIFIIFILFYFMGFIGTIVLPMLGFYGLQGIGQVGFYFYFFGLFYLISKFRFLNVNFSLMADEILSNINEMVMILDTRFAITTANRRTGELLSLQPDRLAGMRFSDLVSSSDDIEDKLRDLLGGNESSLQLRLFYKNGPDTILTDSYLSKVKDRFSDTAGILVISREIKGKSDFRKAYRITAREFEVVDLVLAGYSNKTISKKLQISERTVETHCLHVYNKMGIGNKIELINLAAKFNLLS
jgi:DNA-binding CsgD family transcriptional regulator/PAS domain-containing protein